MNLIQICERIVKNRQYETINDVNIDMQTANCIITVYNAVNDKNKKKLENTKNINLLAHVCWSVYGKTKKTGGY